jgi:hypothetical protein
MIVLAAISHILTLLISIKLEGRVTQEFIFRIRQKDISPMVSIVVPFNLRRHIQLKIEPGDLRKTHSSGLRYRQADHAICARWPNTAD